MKMRKLYLLQGAETSMKIAVQLLAVLMAIQSAGAHDNPGPHGGQIAHFGTLHAELVANNNHLELYVTGADNKPIPVAGYKAVAILIADGKAERVILEPAEANRLTGTANLTLPSKPKGAVRLVAPDGQTHQAKFD
jgi:hypothetical protein